MELLKNKTSLVFSKNFGFKKIGLSEIHNKSSGILVGIRLPKGKIVSIWALIRTLIKQTMAINL